MVNLADEIIRANEEEERVNEQTDEQEKVQLDDIGFPLPKPDTEHAWCEYLTARILYLNKRMYQHQGLLWVDDELIIEHKNTYYKLAKYPKAITDPQCQYVWRRLKELVPVLDTDVIAVLPDWTFNMRTGEFKNERVWTITPWEEEK